MLITAETLRHELEAIADPAVAAVSRSFFKTGAGEYGEGDLFRGIRVPVLRKISRRSEALSLDGIVELLHSPFHEDRLLALLVLVRRFSHASEKAREELYDLYLSNTLFINNWDLVDTSAEHLVGCYLFDRDKAPLYRLVLSECLWERRIAIIATFYFIRHGRFGETLDLAEQLLFDPEELIHKAAGWMLREVGKRDQQLEEAFLARHYRLMPRVMLRYAIERFAEDKRQLYLKGLVQERFQ
ncbi:MAG: DNA alkylation repair protein [Chlorobiaceae bacterium]|jgi:3-methyladenine DNA glycosylase AlkD|nr:DNA alkylation repair protein [Chlorobiaceae bacterium]